MIENAKTIESERRSYYLNHFGDYSNYPYLTNSESDMWKSCKCDDYLNLIVRNVLEDDTVLPVIEDLEQFDNVIKLSLKHVKS